MQPADWHRLSSLFDELAELPAAEREARLADLQPPELAARLARMLATLPDADATATVGIAGFDRQLAQALAEPADRPAPQPGDRFGAWCLAELLGEGGMGQVWRAERADGLYQGEAAIKLLRDDLASPGTPASRDCWMPASRTAAPSSCWSTSPAARCPTMCASAGWPWPSVCGCSSA
jgi:serine/threonine-protein kinase